MKIALFTVMLPDLTPEEAVIALVDAGYDGVEWRVTETAPERQGETPSFWGNNLCTFAPTLAEAERARSLAQSAGLTIPNLGTYLSVDNLAATEQAMRFAQRTHSPQLRVGVGLTGGETHYDDLFERTQTYLVEVERLARQYGLRALIETHQNTVAASASAALRLLEPFSPAHMGVIYDPGNMVIEGFENYRMGLEMLGPYLAHIHIKNAAYRQPEAGGVWQPVWAPLEDGVVDFSAFFSAVAAVNYDGWISIEDFSAARPSREALVHNIEFVRSYLH